MRDDATSSRLAWCVKQAAAKDYRSITRAWEAVEAEKKNLHAFCRLRHEERDCAVLLMKAYEALSDVDGARRVFFAAMRDLQYPGAAVVNTLLGILVGRKGVSRSEVLWILDVAKQKGIASSELTYLYMIEMHIRLDKDPIALWEEVVARNIVPSQAMLRALSYKAVVHHLTKYSSEVLRRLLATTDVDKKHLQFMFGLYASSNEAAPEQALWVLFELEQRCVYERLPLKEYITRATLSRLLLKCARCGDATTVDQLLALLERHLIKKTPETFALAITAYAAAEEVERAFDFLEEMSRRSFLDSTDMFKKFHLDSLGQPMEKHFMTLLAESMRTTALVDRAYYHLEKRKESKRSVSVHSMDVIVLACSKLGDEDRAVETMESYTKLALQPRAQSYNCLLLSCIGRSKARQHKAVFEAMLQNGVSPNSQTFRLLIRQAVLSDNMDEALSYLDKAKEHSHVEVEMILPIMERAAKVGDVELAVKMAEFALECGIGIDGVVMHNAQKRLEECGADASAFAALVSSHVKTRNQTGAGRQRETALDA